jgi:hypothetical protein
MHQREGGTTSQHLNNVLEFYKIFSVSAAKQLFDDFQVVVHEFLVFDLVDATKDLVSDSVVVDHGPESV